MYAVDFDSWREVARKLLQSNIHPAQVTWNQEQLQVPLFDDPIPLKTAYITYNVPVDFMKFAQLICHHRSEERFNLLYNMLWRLIFENKHLLKIMTDPLTNALELMAKSIKRDVHKTKAFVRFRKVIDDDGIEHFIAWHKPDHYSLKLSAPFFQRRFSIMSWTILTPDESVHWDGQKLHYGPAAKASDAPQGDQVELLWKQFYRSIFNPARIKIKAMKKEMPVRFWETMPETAIIDEMLAEADDRVLEMMKHQEGSFYSAADFMPADKDNLESLQIAAKDCKGCPLYQKATQTVFGTGPKNASIVMVGEQPGNEEDKAGHPFIGPAGQILNKALAKAGLKRESIYMTNAVKHFKFEQQGVLRMHRSPNLKDIVSCKPWLESELMAIKPKLVICLGVSAAKSLLTPKFKLDESRGKFVQSNGQTLLTTYHPSAVLRSDDKERIFNLLVQDLKAAKEFLN